MKKLRKVLLITIFSSVVLNFNAFAMTDRSGDGFTVNQPETEQKHEDRWLNNRWTWLNSDICVRFMTGENASISSIQEMYDMGMLSRWIEFVNDEWKVKARDTYAGKWSQSDAEIWSFQFGDKTIPVGVTKIDGILYAFNTFGELREGYEYYGGLTTAADGLVTSEDPEFLKWLETQYIPDCFTQKAAEAETEATQ